VPAAAFGEAIAAALVARGATVTAFKRVMGAAPTHYRAALRLP
jgi:hypothetical protein